MSRRLYLLVIEDPDHLYPGLEELETDLMEWWARQGLPLQLRAVRPGGLLALKVLDELPPLRRGSRDRADSGTEALTRENEHRLGRHAEGPDPRCPVCAREHAADQAADEAYVEAASPQEPAQGVMPLD